MNSNEPEQLFIPNLAANTDALVSVKYSFLVAGHVPPAAVIVFYRIA